MKRVFIIPNAITAFALTCGLFVIFKTSVADPTANLFSLLQASAVLLLIAAVADIADGAVARMIKAESEFGMQFDSLSDAVTFGIAPALLVLKSVTAAGAALNKTYIFFLIIGTMIYALCGVLRLVRYNVNKAKANKSVAEIAEAKKHFTGLPIPAAGSAAVSASLILISPFVESLFTITPQTRAVILTLVLIVLGYFMVSRWKFPSLRALHFRVPSFYLVFATGVVAVMILYGILDFFAEAYFVVAWLYLLIAWSLSLIRLIAGKRSKTLQDYEPDDDE